MQTGDEICPNCSEPLDEQGRCPACWGDVFGICHECNEILNEDGTMARLPELKKVAEKFDLKIISIEDLVEYRMKKETTIEMILVFTC